MKQAHIYIKGEVIGVGFRAWTKIQAKILGIKGWVRNNHEKPELFGRHGGVETVIQGDEALVEKMIQILEKGSPISRVDAVEIYWQEPKKEFEEFEIRK